MQATAPGTLPGFDPGPGAMLFNSAEYLLAFLPMAALAYFWLNRQAGPTAGKAWLVLASLSFYAWWSVAYLWLICGSILFNYGLSRLLALATGARARLLLALAIGGNLALLGYYKYADFFITNVNLLLEEDLPLLHVALPLAISFFTIQQIAYLVDVHERMAVERSFLDYCLFVTFFPHLMAGPILHHKEMMPQFANRAAAQVDWQNIYFGLLILGIGLFKKTVLADSLAFAAEAGYHSPTPLRFHDAWIASLSYTMQIYFDFSGYTDMAIGAALLFNIRLPENFNSPFKAQNLQQYWQRWHMTLTRFITTYIYTPLVRYTPGRISFHKSMVATVIAMFLAGLWHGASWHFVVFGLMHGIGLVISHSWQKTGITLPGWLGWCLTFLYAHTALTIFGADDLPQAWLVLQGMAGLHGFASTGELASLLAGLAVPDTWNPSTLIGFVPARQILILVPALLLVFFAPNTRNLCQHPLLSPQARSGPWLAGGLAGCALFYQLFMTSNIATFIYFYF